MIDELLKADALKDNLVDQIQDLQERIAELERFALTSQNIVATSIICSGDIYTEDWTDYSDDSTITGFASYSTKLIRYARVGFLVFVQFSISGTSDLATTTFTLPYSNTSNPPVNVVMHSRDDSLWGWGRIYLAAESAEVNLYYGVGAGDTWTNTGTKSVRGEFFYKTDN